MKITIANGPDITLGEVKPGEVFKYRDGTNIYLMTTHGRVELPTGSFISNQALDLTKDVFILRASLELTV